MDSKHLDGSEGLATITCQVNSGDGKNSEKIKVKGCVVKKNKTLLNLLNTRLPDKKTEYFVYFHDFPFQNMSRLLNCHEAEVQVYRFTKPEKPKRCKITDRNAWLSLGEHHIISPCFFPGSFFAKSKFLPMCSKCLGQVDFSDCGDNVFLLTIDNKDKIYKIKLSKLAKAKETEICDGDYEIDDQQFVEIRDTSVVFLEDRITVVGCYKKETECNKINLCILGKPDTIIVWRSSAVRTPRTPIDGGPDESPLNVFTVLNNAPPAPPLNDTVSVQSDFTNPKENLSTNDHTCQPIDEDNQSSDESSSPPQKSLSVDQSDQLNPTSIRSISSSDQSGPDNKDMPLTSEQSGPDNKDMALTSEQSGPDNKDMALTSEQSGPDNKDMALTSEQSGPDNKDMALTSEQSGPDNKDMALTSEQSVPDNKGMALTSEQSVPSSLQPGPGTTKIAGISHKSASGTKNTTELSDQACADKDTTDRSEQVMKEKTNFFCLSRLVFEFGTKVLREIIDRKYSEDALRDILQAPGVKDSLKELKNKKLLASRQWQMLYPNASQNPTSSKLYDITLLLILLRNICGLKAPSNGWSAEPSPNDTSLEADIVRIGRFRNAFAHPKTFSVSDSEFETQWNEFVGVLVRQGGEHYKEAAQKLKEHSSEAENERYYRELFAVKEDVDQLRKRHETLEQQIQKISTVMSAHFRYPNSNITSSISKVLKEPIDQTTPFVCAMERDSNIENHLALLLDHEYLVVKNWKHLAHLLKAPPEIIEACKRGTTHSPSLTIFAMPDIMGISKSELIEKFIGIGRNDLVECLSSEKIKGNTLEEISSKNRELLDKMSCKLDIARSPVKGWYELGLTLKIQRGVLDAIKRKNNPARALFLHVYKTLPAEKKTGGASRVILNKLKRSDVEKLLDKYGIKENVEEPLENLLPPESDKMRQLCSLLNTSLCGVIKCWKELAYEWGIPHPVYSAFDPTEKASPTISLLEWVKSNLSGTLTVGQLCKHLKDIERYDAHEFLQKQIAQTSATRQNRE